MVILVTGGSGSGKSAYAESCAEKIQMQRPVQDSSLVPADYRLCKYYLATMQVYGEEGKKKVARHRKMRAGKGFITIEQPKDLSACIPAIGEHSVVLLECMSNLTANEMFCADAPFPVTADWKEIVLDKICRETKELAQAAGHLVIVTNNVFEDGIRYDKGTMSYLQVLGKVNCFLAEMADAVVEVVAGIPVRLK